MSNMVGEVFLHYESGSSNKGFVSRLIREDDGTWTHATAWGGLGKTFQQKQDRGPRAPPPDDEGYPLATTERMNPMDKQREEWERTYREFKEMPVNPDLSPETQELVRRYQETADKLYAEIKRREAAGER